MLNQTNVVFCLFLDETLNILLGTRSFCKADKHNRIHKTTMFTNDPILKFMQPCYLTYQIDLHV